MKFKIIGVLVAICLIPSQSFPLFEDPGLASVAEYDELPATELKRDKRTLTTICVEIKPSSPYEEPYFMCKGTDSPKYSKGSSSGSSDSYSGSKPNYKPSKPSSSYASDVESDSYHSGGVKKNHDYGHATASKPEYHGEHSKYDKPSAPQSTYDSAQDYSSPPSSKPSYDKIPSAYNEHGGIHHSDAYHNYEVPSKASSYGSAKPSYADHHDTSQDDYAKLHHKVTYEKPTYSSKPQSYSHDQPSGYDHRQPSTGYSKPSSYESHTAPGGYSKPSSSYEPSEYPKPNSYDHGSTHPSYEEEHSKPSYGGGGGNNGHPYSAPPETKVLYSKPASYPAKQTSYEHADNTQYGQPKPSYSEQPSAKPYSKPSGHQDYGKPVQSYAPATEQHSGYGPAQNYRMMPQELMQPTWESQPQQYDGFGYRSQGATAMEYQNLESPRMPNPESQMYAGMEGPLRFDLSDTDPEAPTLQSPYRHQTYAAPAYHGHQGASYGPVAPSYTPPVHYVPAAPSYPSYPSAAPAYAPVSAPTYVPLPVPSSSYAPAAPSSYAPAPTSHGSPVPACRQNYMYSFQPVIMSVPCYSMSAGYTSLGAPASQLQDHSSARSESNSEPNTKSTEDHSEESHEHNDKKPDSEVQNSQSTSAMKSDTLKKPSDIPSSEEKQHHQQVAVADKNNNSQGQVVGAEKPISEVQITQNGAASSVTPPKSPEVPNTKEAFNAMMKMARIAAQLNKDDGTNKGPTDALGAGGQATSSGQANGKPAESLPQFTRTQ